MKVYAGGLKATMGVCEVHIQKLRLPLGNLRGTTKYKNLLWNCCNDRIYISLVKVSLCPNKDWPVQTEVPEATDFFFSSPTRILSP